MKHFAGLFLIVLVSISNTSFAQKRANFWVFGNNGGLDFNTLPMTYSSAGGSTNEGVSNICSNTTGQFLFSTDGVTIIDASGNYVPSTLTNSLGGDASSTQSALIIPFPNDTNRYYIFTTASVENIRASTRTGMSYSVFNMTLNGGLGDVSLLNNILLDSTTEKLCGVGNCDGSVYWVLAHRHHSNAFYAYKITAAGIATPVITNIGTPHIAPGLPADSITGANIGYMKFSADGKRVGLCINNPINKIEILDFDFATGKLSNPITDTIKTLPQFDISGSHGPYGCSFSPDGTKFYVSVFKSGVNTSVLNLTNLIYQYNLSGGTASSIIASKTLVAQYVPSSIGDGFGALQNGIDGKLYISNSLTGNVPFFNNPNAAGTACAFTDLLGFNQTLFPSATTSCLFGLPNIIESFLTPQQGNIILAPSLQICTGDTARINLSNGGSFTITPSGTAAATNAGNTLLFYPATNTTYTIYSTSLCGSIDTNIISIQIEPQPSASFAFTPNTSITIGESLTLTNASIDANSYIWMNNGDIVSTAFNYTTLPITPGNYCATLIASNNGCTDTFTDCIRVDPATSNGGGGSTNGDIPFTYNAFSPNGDILNSTFKPWQFINDISELKMNVFDRFGNNVYTTQNINALGWDGTLNNQDCEVGVYYYYIAIKRNNNTSVFYKGDVHLIR
jgi:gliding motility-associated-like protein